MLDSIKPRTGLKTLVKIKARNGNEEMARSYSSSQKEIAPIYPLNGGQIFREIPQKPDSEQKGEFLTKLAFGKQGQKI